MRTITYTLESIKSLFRKSIVATMPQLKSVLGTTANMTVYRKLQQLSYHTSYSHKGGYYTLDELTEFDDLGLWHYQEVHFSKYGTLIRTAQSVIDRSEKGYSHSELRSRLGVEVKEALLHLHLQHRVVREQIAGRYVYFSTDPQRHRQQNLLRLEENPPLGSPKGGMVLAHEVRASIILFFSLLDERQRRLYAGLESLRLGHGGDSLISQLLGIDNHTVARGRSELLERDIEIDRIRKKGAGRMPIKKNSANRGANSTSDEI